MTPRKKATYTAPNTSKTARGTGEKAGAAPEYLTTSTVVRPADWVNGASTGAQRGRRLGAGDGKATPPGLHAATTRAAAEADARSASINGARPLFLFPSQRGRLDSFALATTDGLFVAAEDASEIGEGAVTEFDSLDGGVMPALMFGQGLEEATHGLFPRVGTVLPSRSSLNRACMPSHSPYSGGRVACQKDQTGKLKKHSFLVPPRRSHRNEADEKERTPFPSSTAVNPRRSGSVIE